MVYKNVKKPKLRAAIREKKEKKVYLGFARDDHQKVKYFLCEQISHFYQNDFQR